MNRKTVTRLHSRVVFRVLKTIVMKFCFSFLSLLGVLTIYPNLNSEQVHSGHENYNSNIHFLGSSSFMSDDCAGTDWNDPANKSMLTISATSSTSGNIAVLLDGNLSNNSFFYPDVSIAGLEVLRVNFPSPDILTGLEYVIGDSYMFNTNATFKVQGSNDASTWVDMMPNAEGTSPSLEINGVNYTKNRNLGNTHSGILSSADHTERMFWTNTTAYTYYRILGISGNTNQNPWINELFFQTLDGFEISNIGCTDNGTSEIYSDDLVTFDLTALRGSGTYTLSVDGGYTVSPSSGTFGQSSSFTVSSGSAGAGDLSVTLSDDSIPCTTMLTIPNQVNACAPGPCGEPDWNSPSLKTSITGLYNIPGNGGNTGPLSVLVDSDQGTFASTRNNSLTNASVFEFEFPHATILTGLEINTKANESEPITGGVYRVEASADGITYVALTTNLTHGSDLVAGAPQYGGTGTLAYTFPFSDNTTAYAYYRIYAESMSTSFSRDFTEVYFDYVHFDPQLTNQGCTDNGTFSDYMDDLVTFDLNPVPGISGGTYAVEVSGGFSITPTSGTYGQVTSFVVSSGSSGAGDLTVTLLDAGVPCLQPIIIPNTENACIPGPCGGPDWNVAALKSGLTGDFHIPGTGATDGPLAVLVDSNNGSGVGSKNNNYTNTATFTVNFTESTVLHGIEIVVSGTPITGGVFRVEGSSDGVNYSTVSNDFIFGTNLSLGTAQYGTGSQAYTFPFADNTADYSYYRIYAESMSTAFGPLFNNHSFTELYFDYDVFNAGIDNISFGDNSTSGVFDDDVIDFELNPSPGTGTYSVQVLGGHTVSPTTGTYGQVSSFQISAGSAGTGDLTLLLIDQNVPCVQEVTLPNPDLTASVTSSQAACSSPTDDPLGSITFTSSDGTYTKAEYNIGTTYAGSGFAAATEISNTSSGVELVGDLPNPTFTTYYTVRAYVTETLFRDFVVSLDPKVCSVADLQLTVSPVTESANEGEQLTYTVNLNNAGPSPALNVEVRVDIPDGLELLSTSPSIGDFSPGTQLWTTDLLPVGNHELSITYRMK